MIHTESKSLSYKQQTSKQYFRNTATKSCFLATHLKNGFRKLLRHCGVESI